MDEVSMRKMVRALLNDACSACKPLLWLRDTDSPLPLVPALCEPLGRALDTVIRFPNALPALEGKLGKIYDRALKPPYLIGIGAQPRSSRLGRRTGQEGLLAAVDYARARRAEFAAHAHEVCQASTVDWLKLFDLAKELIDNLDWGEFVIENARGQSASLVLEAVELLDAVLEEAGLDSIQSEVGDVFFNLMAFCLSMRIRPEHILNRADFVAAG